MKIWVLLRPITQVVSRRRVEKRSTKVCSPFDTYDYLESEIKHWAIGIGGSLPRELLSSGNADPAILISMLWLPYVSES